MATESLGKSINAYVVQDEARHVMFGRLALRDYYPRLRQAERDERELNERVAHVREVASDSAPA